VAIDARVRGASLASMMARSAMANIIAAEHREPCASPTGVATVEISRELCLYAQASA
jgi:hypothetical protein